MGADMNAHGWRYGQPGTREMRELPARFACDVLMEDGTWEPAEVLSTDRTRDGYAAFVRWRDLHFWLLRDQPNGDLDEWRRSDDPED